MHGGASFIVRIGKSGQLKWYHQLNVCFTVNQDFHLATGSQPNTPTALNFQETIRYLNVCFRLGNY